MHYSYVKAIHIVFIVSWFAALFYIVRLFIYTTEANGKVEPGRSILKAQLLLMQRKLWYIIGWPSMAGALIFGVWMLILNPILLSLPWMWLKLISVVLLMLYHFECQLILTQQKKDIFKHSSFKLRLFNELATVFLVAIVFLVIVKSTSGLLWGILGLVGFAATLMLAVFIYKKRRNQAGEQNKNINAS
jgi:protoporphyrinogen IX oxidase